MKFFFMLVVIIVVLAGIIANIYFWQKRKESQEPSQVEQLVEPSGILRLPEKIDEPVIRYPVSEEVEKTPGPVVQEEALPALDESDGYIREALNGLFNPQLMGDLFLFKAFIRHFVVTIDNMTAQKLPQRYVFTKRPVGKFTVKQKEFDSAMLDPKNYDRYASFVTLAEIIDTRALVTVYVRNYPLFQGAYEDLGYLGRYFNDRFIEVIDHLLVTPEVEEPIQLVRPKVFYKFADPELEALSAGQKILIRIGPENAMRVKTKLRGLRQELAANKI